MATPLLQQMNLNADERERIAYAQGRPMLAALFAEAVGLDDAAEAASEAQNYIQEARGAFVAEDFMSDEFIELRNAIGAMRKGASRDVLQDLLTRMEAKRDEQAQAAEYASEQLDKAHSALEG